MYPDQVFKNFNVAHPLLKFVFFDENQPTRTWVLRKKYFLNFKLYFSLN